MRLVYNVLFLTVILLIGIPVAAQTGLSIEKNRWNPFRKNDPDTSYVKTYKEQLLISAIGTRKFQELEIISKNPYNALHYKPNNPFSFGVGFSYRSLSIDLTMKFPYLTRNYKLKGESDIFRVRLGYNRPRLWFSTMFQLVNGFYLYNIEKFDPDWFDDHQTFMLRPDIMNISWYTAAYYSFNHDRITYQSSLGWEQRQKKTAGTFLLGGSIYTNYLSADSSMVPREYMNDFSEDLALTEQFNLQAGINIGYVQTILLWSHFYVTLAVYPGIHYQIAHHITPLQGKKDISGDFGSVSEARAVIGYNTDKYYFGATYNQIALLFFPQNTVLTNGYAHLKIFAGRRFNIENLFKPHKHRH